MPDRRLFYAEGLKFTCTKCSACCRHESGFVFLGKKDAASLAKEQKMTYTQFVKTFCRWIPSENSTERLSLKEKANYDCIFWDSGCKVYNSRPLQCRVFPFWPNIMAERTIWIRTGMDCPGMNQGQTFTKDEIEEFLKLQDEQPVITRKTLSRSRA